MSTTKYTSHDFQNELIRIMSLEVLRSLVKKIQHANFYSVMADETCDVSNIERLSFGVGYIEILNNLMYSLGFKS